MHQLHFRHLFVVIALSTAVSLIYPWHIQTAAAAAPVATQDGYLILPNTVLQIAAPGVLWNDVDPDGGPLTAVLVTGVTNGFLTLNPDGSFVYQPNAGFVGTDTFVYQVDDGTELSPGVNVSIRVNNEPIANDDAYTTPLDVQLMVFAPGILANDVDPDGTALTASLFLTTSFGTLFFNQNDGSFIYNPFSGFEGTDQFAYEAYDGIENGGPATVTITVGDGNHAPVAADDPYTTSVDTPLVVPAPGPLVNDSDADGDALAIAPVTSPANGTLIVDPNGAFTYTPDPGFEGPDGFTYRAFDGASLGNTATVTIDVGDANHPPVAGDDAFATAEDTILTVLAPGVLANDSDADGDVVTLQAHDDSSLIGTIVFDDDGGFVFTPDPGFVGTTSFVYRAFDGGAVSNNATVTIEVTAGPDPSPESIARSIARSVSDACPGQSNPERDGNGDGRRARDSAAEHWHRLSGTATRSGRVGGVRRCWRAAGARRGTASGAVLAVGGTEDFLRVRVQSPMRGRTVVDDRRFDNLTVSLARGISRRRLVNATAFATSLLALRRRADVAAQDDRDSDPSLQDDGTNYDDLPLCAGCGAEERCVAGVCCPQQQDCFDVCCPPVAVGCTSPPTLPDGTVGQAGCLCPNGQIHDESTNRCVYCFGIGSACDNDGDCCSGACEEGACRCKHEGEPCKDFECCSGGCGPDGTCTACTAPGGACAADIECCGMQAGKSGWGKCLDGVCRCCLRGAIAACGAGDNPGFDLCCDYPLVGYMCCDDLADCSTCQVGCCTDGVDCDTATNTFPGCSRTARHVSEFSPDPSGCSR